MEHNQKTSIKPINASSSEFGQEKEKNFVVLEDGKHVIGLDANDPSKLILENLKTGKADKFEGDQSDENYITTLMYDKDKGFLYTGDDCGKLLKYKVDIE